jgi:hypothetical protein
MADIDYATLPRSVREFRPLCPGCTPDVISAEGARPCSSYDCPGLPKELQVSCALCMYDFAAGDGQPKCDHRTCETALRLQKNVDTYKAWVEMIKPERSAL